MRAGFIPRIFIVSLLFVPFLFSVSAASTVNPHTPKKPVILKIHTLTGIIKKGDTASSILDPYLPLKTIYAISRHKVDGFSLTRIKKGQPYKLTIRGNDLVRFEYEINDQDRLVVKKEKDQFVSAIEKIEYDLTTQTITAQITTNLANAVRNAGEGYELALKLSDIFAWDIDFIRDIRPGDRFKVLVQKRYRDGKFAGYGQIQAAFFVNRGMEFKAFLYEDATGVKGYYDENGQSMQKAFLKAPLSFSRISSKFSKRRLHPIFKEYRPHTGVDYAAPTGTPIKTVGDGIITRMGYNKGMGNFIMVRHYNGYSTHYYHMSRFARGMKKNKKLIQGDLIGYVGQTGYATGPHLDFRLNKNGKPIDPLKHRSPSANPVKPEEMDQFLAVRSKLSSIMLTEKKIAFVKKPT